MPETLHVINASSSPEPLYVFVMPNPAWALADGFAGLVSLIIPYGELVGPIKDLINVVGAADTAASTGALADAGAKLGEFVDWLSNTWVGEGSRAAYEAGKMKIKSIYELYDHFSQVITLMSTLNGIRKVIGGKAELEAVQRWLDGIFRSWEKVFEEHAYKVAALDSQGYDEISKNPLDYLAPSGWAALADADTAHLTVYRKGKFLANFNAHSRSSYVCTEDLVWRIAHGGSWADRSETIHGIVPLDIGEKPSQDVECYYKHDLDLKGDPKDGYELEVILTIKVKPQHRVLPMTLRVDMTWSDQGFGNQKGRLYMTLMRNGEPVQGSNGLVRVVTGPAPHTMSTLALEYPEDSYFVNSMLPGDEIVFSVVVGAGGGHELHVKSLLVTLPLSTLIYRGPPCEKRIATDDKIRNLYQRFPLVTHPHKAIPDRGDWVPKIKGATVVVNWQAPTILTRYELDEILAGKTLPQDELLERVTIEDNGNDSVSTVIEVWKDGVMALEENLWTNAPDPDGLEGPDLWKQDAPEALLKASQLTPGPDVSPIEWAFSIRYEPDNYWPIFRRETHLQIFTFAVFVEYHW